MELLQQPSSWSCFSSFISIFYFKKKSAFSHSCKMRLNTFFLHLKSKEKGREIHYMLESRLFVEAFFCIIIIIMLTLKLDFVIFFNESERPSEWEINVKRRSWSTPKCLCDRKRMFTYDLKPIIYSCMKTQKSKIVIRRFLLCKASRNQAPLNLYLNHDLEWVHFDYF